MTEWTSAEEEAIVRAVLDMGIQYNWSRDMEKELAEMPILRPIEERHPIRNPKQSGSIHAKVQDITSFISTGYREAKNHLPWRFG
jgi:hypothetical protein